MSASERRERARADHACDACGGSGRAENVRGLWLHCPVCQGSGRISDRMPVADALADAETLRALAYNRVLGDDASEAHLANAEAFGKSASRAMKGEIPDAPCSCGCGKPALRWHFAERAAAAAFRACPGLRG